MIEITYFEHVIHGCRTSQLNVEKKVIKTIKDIQLRKDQIRLPRKLLKSVAAFEPHKLINGLTLHNNYIQKL